MVLYGFVWYGVKVKSAGIQRFNVFLVVNDM